MDIENIVQANVIDDGIAPNLRLPEGVRTAGYIPHLPDILFGDLVLFCPRNPGFLQRRIIKTQRGAFNESEASFTHAAVYLHDYLICEAVGGGVQVGSLLDSLIDCKLLIRRPKYLPGENGFMVAMRSLMRLSQKYDYFYILKIVNRARSGLHKAQYRKFGDRFGADTNATDL